MHRDYLIIGILAAIALVVAYFALRTPPGETTVTTTTTTTSTTTTITTVEAPTSTAPITVSSPAAGALAASPLEITGQARGNWYFEAVFPVELQDSHGNVIARGQARAQSDWMTTDFVPFTATLTFGKPPTPTGELILRNDNPSGDPSRAQEILVPVRFQ